MAIQRWDPFHDMRNMREAMERLFQESVLRPASSFIPGMRHGVPVDVIERDESYLVRAALPGVRPDDVQVTLQGPLLIIRGEAGEVSDVAEEKRGQRWLLRECRVGAFYRAITLPAAVDADQTSARFRQGMLELTLPKAEIHRPRRINIQGASAMRNVSPNGNGSPTPNASDAAKAEGKPPAAHEESQREDLSDIVNEASEESFPASDAPAWSRERH